MKTPPKIQVDAMPADKFFAYGAELMKLHPPHLTDEPIIASMKRIGIEVGKSFDIDKVEPAVRNALERAPQDAQEPMQWKLRDPRQGRERLVDEHGHDGRLWQLLPQTRDCRAIRPRREPARGCDLSNESWR